MNQFLMVVLDIEVESKGERFSVCRWGEDMTKIIATYEKQHLEHRILESTLLRTLNGKFNGPSQL